MIRLNTLAFAAVLLLNLGSVKAGEEAAATKTTVPQEISAAETALKEDSLAVMLTTGFMPDQQFRDSPRSYTNIPISASLLWTFDDVANDDVLWGWFRGNTSFRVTPFHMIVLNGPETRFTGLMAGPQYNFIQPGWKIVPYLGSAVGLAFTDSTNALYAQGQDFCFTFNVNAGARYFLNEKWSVMGELTYQHFSNGGLSEPKRQNTGLDLFGPQFSVAYGF